MQKIKNKKNENVFRPQAMFQEIMKHTRLRVHAKNSWKSSLDTNFSKYMYTTVVILDQVFFSKLFA